MGGKWKPSREGIECAFNELASGIARIDLPRSDCQIVLDLCYARRDLQLALLGYRSEFTTRRCSRVEAVR